MACALREATPSTPRCRRRQLVSEISDPKQPGPSVRARCKRSDPQDEPEPKRLRFSPSAESSTAAVPSEDSTALGGVAAPAPAPTTPSSTDAVAADETPEQYPMVAREEECKTLDDFLRRSLSSQQKSNKEAAPRGGCLYVSGGPGTGKTCSVRAAVAEWRRHHSATQVVTVNCMQLTQRSPTGLLKRVAEVAQAATGSSCSRTPLGPSSGTGLVTAVASRLSQLGPSIIVIADEVDQVLDKRPNHKVGGPDSLETLVALTQVPGSAAISLICIANAVDLLERGGHALLSRQRCEALLFQPYAAPQLKSILQARLAKAGDIGAAAAKALGLVATELRVRQVAKHSGDCRQIMCFCEQALFEAQAQQAAAVSQPGSNADTPCAAEGAPTPHKTATSRKSSAQNDPLAQVKQLPLEHQMLLCALAASEGESMRLSDICARYKDYCRRLHQPANLGCKDQVSSALNLLEQRGLLSLRAGKRVASARPAFRGVRMAAGSADRIAELAVSCKAVRESIKVANPLLEKCLDNLQQAVAGKLLWGRPAASKH